MPGKVNEVVQLPLPRPKGVEAKFEKFIERIVAKHTVNTDRLVCLPRYRDSPVPYRCCLSGSKILGIDVAPNNGPNAGCMCSYDQVVVGGVTSLWRPSFQSVSRGATIVFQLDRFTRIIASSPFVVYCQKSIHRCYHNERLIMIDFGSSLSCHVGSRKRKTDYYLSLRNMKKKSCQKKTIITIDGVNRIPTTFSFVF